MRDEVIRGLKMKRNEDEDIRGYLNFLHIILLLKYNYKTPIHKFIKMVNNAKARNKKKWDVSYTDLGNKKTAR